MPNEIPPVIISMSGDRFTESRQRASYAGVHVAYKVRDKFETIGKIWSIHGMHGGQQDYWVDEEPE